MKQAFQKEIKNIKNNPKSNNIMKKVIAIAAVVIIAILGLSSYNTNEVKKNETNSTLLASINNGGTGSGNSAGGGVGIGNKKLD